MDTITNAKFIIIDDLVNKAYHLYVHTCGLKEEQLRNWLKSFSIMEWLDSYPDHSIYQKRDISNYPKLLDDWYKLVNKSIDELI